MAVIVFQGPSNRSTNRVVPIMLRICPVMLLTEEVEFKIKKGEGNESLYAEDTVRTIAGGNFFEL